MKTKRLAEYLDHIRQAAIDAEAFVEGMSKSDFLADRRTQQAVVMSIIIVGEAATKVLERHGDFAKHQHRAVGVSTPDRSIATDPRP
ncbi:HepT-like ribonuclease domain-containing protein [Phyllobacterium endophyticum]|uniref:DUF86 domain-containing protein n=1 Tax=Phyllobacterium endophyticum TaxID=1149773 RepID=A0A2P7AL27_9HYPH|nr:uncharacterized protein with HEPN domain [Phyllobacterium endophyticum]PSH54886.1 hypothetical protein CU100_25285 [Phyllobacterium endophyticum]TYR43242.1 DUF86 domain-containing protein [Phyllobacterium endophyticum]